MTENNKRRRLQPIEKYETGLKALVDGEARPAILVRFAEDISPRALHRRLLRRNIMTVLKDQIMERTEGLVVRGSRVFFLPRRAKRGYVRIDLFDRSGEPKERDLEYDNDRHRLEAHSFVVAVSTAVADLA